MSNTNSKEVAATIIRQLGGNRFLMMTGAKNLVAISDGMGGLAFKLPKFNGVKVNIVRIVLNHNDLYDIEFGRQYGMKYTVLNNVNDVYCDQLCAIFESETGLATRL